MTIKLSCGKGEEDLSSEDKSVLDKLSKEYESKISKHVSEVDEFEIHLKCHRKEGNTKRYSLEVRFISGKFKFETSSDEYNLSDAIHKAMKKLLSEIEHKVNKEKDERASWKKKARSGLLYRREFL